MPFVIAWLRTFLPIALGWLLRARVAWIGIKLGYRLILIVAMAALLPMPDWALELPSKLASLPSSAFWFAELFQLRYGLYVLMSAYTFRWIWRQLSSSV